MTNGKALLVLAVALYGLCIVGGYVGMTLGWGAAVMWIDHYQTLITGILALSSAAVGAWFLQQQVSQADRHEHKRIARRHAAVRAILPLSLSAMTRYAVTSAGTCKLLLDQCNGESFPARNALNIPPSPVLPDSAISVLREFMETLEPGEVRTVAILIADIQVQFSRLTEALATAGTGEGLIVKSNIEDYVIDCAMIYARASSFFDFARGADEFIPKHITWQQVRSALFFFGIYDGAGYDRIFETINQRSGGNLSAVVEPRWTSQR